MPLNKKKLFPHIEVDLTLSHKYSKKSSVDETKNILTSSPKEE